MTHLFEAIGGLIRRIDRLGDAALPTLARLVFAGTLLIYYWRSARTKLGDGVFGILSPSDGAYIQILPWRVEAISYDFSQLTVLDHAIVLAGTWAELLLPLLLLLGLATRLAALGMIGFVTVQSLVDTTHAGFDPADLGMWFDGNPSALILDQRAFWVLMLLVLVLKGAGPLSADRLIGARMGVAQRMAEA